MNVKMLSLTATPMLLWALVASASDVVTVTLVGGGRVTAPLLRQSEEGVVLDLGYDVLQIPAKRLLDVRREDEATGEPARAAVDRGIFRTGRLESREVPALVKRFGEAVVMVKTPGGLGTGFLVSREGHLITNYHVVEKQTQLRVTMFREVAAKGAAGTAAKTPPASGQGTGFEKIEFRKVKIIALQPLRDFGPRAAAEEAPASVSRSIRAEPQAAKSRHGTRDRQRQQATRSHDRRRWERRSRDGGCCDANPNQKPRSHDTSRIAWAKLMARVGEEFPLECPACGGDIRLIAFITEPGPIREILTHLGEPLEPPPVSPARGPPTDWGELVQVHDDRDVFQGRINDLPASDIHSL